MRERRVHRRRLSAFAAAVSIGSILLSISSREHFAFQSFAASAPANLGDLKQQITEYKRSGGYDHDVAAVLANAEAYVVRRASAVRMPAIILDIDETSLSTNRAILPEDTQSARISCQTRSTVSRNNRA